MIELEKALTGDSAAAPPSHILEAISPDLAHRTLDRAPHTIYAELWHITFWLEMTLDWIAARPTPFPVEPALGFPSEAQTAAETWEQLCARFFAGIEQAAAATRDAAYLDEIVRCPSRPEEPERRMSVRDQLESLAAHNAYHFGRIVLLRQLADAWPPASGGFSW